MDALFSESPSAYRHHRNQTYRDRVSLRRGDQSGDAASRVTTSTNRACFSERRVNPERCPSPSEVMDSRRSAVLSHCSMWRSAIVIWRSSRRMVTPTRIPEPREERSPVFLLPDHSGSTWQTKAKARRCLAVRFAPARCSVRQLCIDTSPRLKGQGVAPSTLSGSVTRWCAWTTCSRAGPR
jgi:hypothetical protein